MAHTCTETGRSEEHPHTAQQGNNQLGLYWFASSLARGHGRRVDTLVSLQGGGLGELLVTHAAAVGLVASVAHTVAQQTLGVRERLCTHLRETINKLISHIWNIFERPVRE